MDLLPSLEMRVDAAWLAAAMLAADLHACLQLLSLDGELAKATPKTLHYRVLHIPGASCAARETPFQAPCHLALCHGDHPRRRTDPRPSLSHLTSMNEPAEHREGVIRTLRDSGTRRHPARELTHTLTSTTPGQGSARHHGRETRRPPL